ncbi:MAG TPA: RNA polymerase sigma factor [Edaphobacter sp.]|nr:RNA polymerase sigma factor [Edaphobacter sp.]
MFWKQNGSTSQDTAGIEHINGLFSYALVLTRNHSDAEDLVQETYIRAIGAKRRPPPDSNIIKSWMLTILRNIWLNQLRQRRTTAKLIDTDTDESIGDIAIETSKDPYESYVSKVKSEQVRRAIQQLPVDFREIILLRVYGELSYQEIASVLGCPTGTVMSRLGRARSRLRTLLSRALEIPVPPGKKDLE